MKVVTGLDALVGKYVCDKIGMVVTNTPFVGLAVKDAKGQFVAGIVISNYRGSDCEISMAAETANWARRGVMEYVFDYIFNKNGCVRCTCIVKNDKNDANSKRTTRFLRGIGFQLEGNLRRAYDGHYGALVYGLLAEDCRWLRGSNGEEVRSSGSRRARSVRDSGGADATEPADGYI